MKITTTRLHMRPRDFYRLHERHIRDGLIGAWMATALLLIWTLLRPVEAPQAPLVKISQVAPAIMLMTTTPAPPLPTATPWPTPEPQVIIQQAEPQVVYVPVEAQPTPAPFNAGLDGNYEPPAPPPPDAPQQSGPGGSGVMPAFDVGPIPTPGEGKTDFLWCAGAAVRGAARCVGR